MSNISSAPVNDGEEDEEVCLEEEDLERDVNDDDCFLNSLPQMHLYNPVLLGSIEASVTNCIPKSLINSNIICSYF